MTDELPGADDPQAPDAPGPGDPCTADRLRDAEAWLIAETSQGTEQAYKCGRCGGWHLRNGPAPLGKGRGRSGSVGIYHRQPTMWRTRTSGHTTGPSP